jgi:hypothetical protein
MAKTDLEAQLAALTHEFVAKLVDAIRNASFGEVAALSQPMSPRSARGGRPGPKASRRSAARVSPGRPRTANDITRTRQTAARRAELAEQIVRTLRGAGRPLGVRALSGELGVAPDLLATPLRELRVAGQILKHGEKRTTTYSTAQ